MSNITFSNLLHSISHYLTHLAHVVGTIIKVFSTVVTRPAKGTLTFVACPMVDTRGSIFTRIKLLGAESNFRFTKLPSVASGTGA